MQNEIYINNKLIIELNKNLVKKQYYLLEDDTKIFNVRKLKAYLVQIKCNDCEKLNKIHFITKNHLVKNYCCKHCGSLGNRNGFFGKKHTEKLKNKFREARKDWYIGENNPMYNKSVYDQWVIKYGKEKADELELNRRKIMSEKFSGENNPFFGKTHSKETINKIKEANDKYREQLTDSERASIAEKQSESQKRCRLKNPEMYKQNKSNAAKISAQSQSKYKINKIESIVKEELNKRNIKMTYCVILDFLQFDFGNKENKILLEVQGDYWHGNPRIYSSKLLNAIQVDKIKKDKIKLEFAQRHGFKIFYIWEFDINNNNFSVLDEIKTLLKT